MNTQYPIGKSEILLGWVCNQNCIFCSVGHKLTQSKKVMTFEQVKNEIAQAKNIGARVISFSGGEPTIIPYLIDAISYANKLGFEEIEIQTNGRMLAYEDYAKKVLDAGTNRFLFSIHGNTPELHDYLVKSKGAFKQALKGMENINKLKGEREIDLRTSTVLTKFNYKLLSQIVKLLLGFGVNACHVGAAIIDGHAYTNKNTLIVKMSELAPFIHKAIDEVRKMKRDIWIYSMPYCLMQGYEKTIAELGTSDTILNAPDFTASIQEHRHSDRTKKESCKDCKYADICLGVWTRYVNLFGFDEFKPVSNDK